jgi:bifunctional non-homologous end joining protein LigD
MKPERIVEGVRLSSPDKVLYPEQGITKGQLADYYVAVAERILPHLAFRPVTMVRCPMGQETKCFYQRHAGSGVPEQLHEVTIPGFDEPYLYISDPAGLVAMVQMGVLEMHPWGVKVEAPDRADRIVFDLDPAEGLGFEAVIEAAKEVRDRLRALGLTSFVKTTGGKGLHVVVPVEATAPWKEVKSFAKGVSAQMAADSPDKYLTKISKAERDADPLGAGEDGSRSVRLHGGDGSCFGRPAARRSVGGNARSAAEAARGAEGLAGLPTRE